MPADTHKWHFGVLSFTGTGHLTPLIALGQELQKRGHRVTFFEKPKIGDRVKDAGLEFVPIGQRKSPRREVAPPMGRGFLSELIALRFNLDRVTQDVQRSLEMSPAVIAEAGVDVLIVNEIVLTGPTVAQVLDLPYFIISTSFPHRFGWRHYRRSGGYRGSRSLVSSVERMLLELSCLRMRGPIRHAIDSYRRRLGLGPVRNCQDEYPCLAHITQMPQFLDLPRSDLPKNFHYAGPLARALARPPIEFPWERLDGRPLIYASLGTTRNVQPETLTLIARACSDLDVQLVIALGNRFEPSQFADLPGNSIVTKYAPQLDLLEMAELVITHGGTNTVMETLNAGKPMIVIPLAYDQPANALRLERLGVAAVLPVVRLTPERIGAAVLKVLKDPRYREAALLAQSKLMAIDGTGCAADVIEESLAENPVSSGQRANASWQRANVREGHESVESTSYLWR